MTIASTRQSSVPLWVQRFALLGPALLGMIVHVATLANGLVFDDLEAIRDNPVVQGSFAPLALLRRDFWGRLPGTPGSVGTWRPLVEFTLWLDRHLASGAAFPYHLSNLFFHGFAVFAFTYAIDRHLRDRRVALVAGAIFAVLGVGTEAVASVVARADSLSAGFSFLAFAALPAASEKVTFRRATLASLALFAGLLCKEAAIAAPAWMFVADAVLAPSDMPRDEKRKRLAIIVIVAVVALIAYLAVRLPTFGTASSLARSYNNNPLIGASFGTRTFTALRLLGMAVQLTLLPLQLAPDYSFAEILPSQSLFASGTLVGLAVLFSMTAFAFAWRRRSPPVVLAVAMFLLPWLVVSNVFVLLPTIFAERLLYAPAAGIALLMALGESALRQRDRRTLATGLLLFVIVGNAARSVSRDADWHDSLSLFSQAVLDTPDCARAWNNLGAAEMEAHHPVQAVRALSHATQIAPEWAAPYALLGGVLDELGQPDQAEISMRRALHLDPGNATAHKNLAVFLARHGRLTEALVVAREGLAMQPANRALQLMVRQLMQDLARTQP